MIRWSSGTRFGVGIALVETVSNEIAALAVIEHHRWWIAGDGIHLARIKNAADQKLPVDVAKRIAHEYGVIRNIGTHVEKNDGKALARLVKEINNANWPHGLVNRANLCLEIAKAHKIARKGSAKKVHTPNSAVTKLMWFLHPKGWTMFDQYARIGLIGDKNCLFSFYKRLEKCGFERKATEIDEACKANGFSDLFGERIIDKFLLLRGLKMQKGQAAIDDLHECSQHYLNLLPTDLAKRLNTLSQAIAKVLNDNAFPMLQEQKSRRSSRAKTESEFE